MTDSLTANIVFQSGLGRVGPERIRVLEAIENTGSITGAGKQLGLSFRACWDTVQTLNNLFGEPLIVSTPGGQASRGAELTEPGRRLLADYRELQREMAEIVPRLKSRLGEQADKVAAIPLVSLRSTARNVWRVMITSIVDRGALAEVDVELAQDITLAATVPARSLADLDIAEGSSALVIVNPFAITLSEPEAPATPSHNRLAGVVTRREDSEGISEIQVDLGAGKTLFATVENGGEGSLAAHEGDTVHALIRPIDVILFAT